jgi:hypothetical protein
MTWIIGNFDVVKGISKFLLGAGAVAVAFLVSNPDIILNLLPQTFVALGLGGLVVELVDYIKNCIDQWNEQSTI